MRHHIFDDTNTTGQYPVVLLFKNNAFLKHHIETYFVDPLVQLGVARKDIIAFNLLCAGKSPKAKEVSEYLEQLTPILQHMGTKQIYCADSAYFKKLASRRKSEDFLSYMLPSIIEGIDVTFGYSYSQIIYDSTYKDKADRALNSIAESYKGTYVPVGSNIIKGEYYPRTVEDIAFALKSLHQYEAVTIDIEAFSLNIHEANIATISFAIDEHHGICFPVDYVEHHIPQDNLYGYYKLNPPVRDLLKQFLTEYRGKLIAHKSDYDFKVLIYTLFMENASDHVGMIDAIDLLHPKIEDSLLVSFCALNSTEDYKLGLKALAHEFAGNYGQDNINDVRKIPLQQLLTYNLKDTLCTWYVYKKYYPVLEQDNQTYYYEEILLKSLKVVLEMSIWGLPVLPTDISKAEAELTKLLQAEIELLKSTKFVKRTQYLMRVALVDKYNKTHQKQKTLDDFRTEEINFNSKPQMAILLYEVMNYPVIDLTASKQPSAGSKTIKKLLDLETDEVRSGILDALINYSSIEKILSGFIPAFKAAYSKGDGRAYINGSFNLGATISGRLSSSDPNMMNMPAGSTFGKLIKSFVSAPVGWLFGSADFKALEEMTNSLLTKDPNKLAVYEKGYDGHSLRAYTYWSEYMPDIDPNSVESINSIEHKYPKHRKSSKAPTFAMQYMGTYITLMKNCGFTMEQAKAIVERFQTLYSVSIEWLAQKIEEACQRGYVELAFGLRLRTPLLHKTILGTRNTPYQAEADARSAGNALSGQSYGALNNRASIEFMERVRASKYRYDIIACMWIHDAIYLLFKNDADVVEWVNTNLVECMKWQELPELQHPTVKLGATLGIHYPTWAQEITIPNNSTKEQIVEIARKAMEKDDV